MNKTEIIVKDGNRYFYTTSVYNAENPLGVIKATLKEYTVYRPESNEAPVARLYKTEEGNWYDLAVNTPVNPLLATLIKMAIDESEKAKSVIDTEI